jgi:hypothetical protein
VPGPSFYFKLEFTSERVSEGLLEGIASQMLQHLGCSPQEVPDLDAALSQATATAAATRRCDLRFRLENGALEIVVSSNDGRLFHASHSISDRS